MTDPVRVFVNGKGYSVPPGSTVLDAIAIADPLAAVAVSSGTRLVADSRGIPVPMDTPVTGGFVMRLISARNRSAGESEE